MKLKKSNNSKKRVMKFLDGYQDYYNDGYTESPFGHSSTSTDQDQESEYFMQMISETKLERLSLRTPVGYRATWGYARDFWNNRLGIRADLEKNLLEEFNRDLIKYLISRKFFQESEKITGWEIVQGETILMKYFSDEGDINKYQYPPPLGSEILGVEAINKKEYHISEFDEFGNPKWYLVQVKTKESFWGTVQVKVHPSRVQRRISENIEWRYTGHSRLSVAADAIIILATILKAAGEAAFRWGTGHPTIFTKDIFDSTSLTKLQTAIGDPTRRSWHILPTEFVDRIEMLGQAGTMLNLKSLADIAMEQIVIAFEIPKPILLGEVTGVTGSEVIERTYFSKLDKDHTNFEPFVREFFLNDLNVHKIFDRYGLDIEDDEWSIDWGIREVLNKMDEIDYKTKEASYWLALSQILSVNEVRKGLGYEEIAEDEGGSIILGLESFIMLETEEVAQQGQQTQKETGSIKDPNKNKQGRANSNKLAENKAKVKDALAELFRDSDLKELAESMNLHQKTLMKIANYVGVEA